MQPGQLEMEHPYHKLKETPYKDPVKRRESIRKAIRKRMGKLEIEGFGSKADPMD